MRRTAGTTAARPAGSKKDFGHVLIGFSRRAGSLQPLVAEALIGCLDSLWCLPAANKRHRTPELCANPNTKNISLHHWHPEADSHVSTTLVRYYGNWDSLIHLRCRRYQQLHSLRLTVQSLTTTSRHG